MEVIDKKIEELSPYAKNPRKNDQAVKAVAQIYRASINRKKVNEYLYSNEPI